jgi:serine/threonine protein kinase
VKAIRIAEKLDFIKVPKIILDQTALDYTHVPAIWLEYIKGKNPEQSEGNILKILNILFLWYEKQGIDFVEPDGLASNYLEKEMITSLKLLSYGWNVDETELILNAFKRIIECNKTMPISWIHGDVSIGNCLIDEEGQIVFLDWEISRRDYIANDVSKLVRQGGSAVKQAYTEWLKKYTQCCSDVLHVDAQLDIVYLCNNVNIQEKEKYFMNTKSSEQSKIQIVEIKQRLLSIARKMCDELYFGGKNEQVNH